MSLPVCHDFLTPVYSTEEYRSEEENLRAIAIKEWFDILQKYAYDLSPRV